MKTLFLAAALSGTVIAGCAGTAALAQRGGGGGGGMWASADANGDGIITHDEFMAQATQRFQRMDANSDGTLAGDELHGRMAERAQGGAITKAQFMADAETCFQKLDANHDGKLTPDEMAAMRSRYQSGGRRGEAGAGDHDMAAQMPAPDGQHGPGRRLERLDTNHDGRISREEMRADADRRFDRMDTNHDGFIDEAEMAAARPPMHRWHGGGDMPPPPPADGADRNTGQ